MKTINKINFLGVIFSLAIIASSCDLELQEDFKFVPEVNIEDPFDNLTAWEFLQNRTTIPFENDKGELITIDGEKFDYLVEAIKVANFENEYNSSNRNRTYLLLNNNAFTGRGDIINLITGSDNITDDNGTPDNDEDDRLKTPAEIFANADIEILRTILRYHIITVYVDQVPTLREFGVNYIFQTLIPGETGRIQLRRDNRNRIAINSPPSILPRSATSQRENVRGHNYVFNNGIGHIIADPVRYEPYN